MASLIKYQNNGKGNYLPSFICQSENNLVVLNVSKLDWQYIYSFSPKDAEEILTGIPDNNKNYPP